MDTEWSTFAVIAGGSAAALVGLLFVAISIRVDVIARSPELRNRAAQTLVLFGTALLVGILLSLPGQSYQALAAEVLVLAAAVGAGLLALDLRGDPAERVRGVARTLDVITPNGVTSVLLLAAGVVLMFGTPAGLYLLVCPVLTALVGGVASAWLFMTRVTS